MRKRVDSPQSKDRRFRLGAAVALKLGPDPGPHNIYGFLTTTPHAIAEPIHPKAMPVILTTPEQYDVWMRALWDEEGATAPAAR